MTEEELLEIERAKGVMVKAINIRPYFYDLACMMGDRGFLNTLCCRRWAEDRSKIWWLLDSHNTFSAKPDEMVLVVPNPNPPTGERLERLMKSDRQAMNRSRSGRTPKISL
jgi:hypothetical protein